MVSSRTVSVDSPSPAKCARRENLPINISAHTIISFGTKIGVCYAPSVTALQSIFETKKTSDVSFEDYFNVSSIGSSVVILAVDAPVKEVLLPLLSTETEDSSPLGYLSACESVEIIKRVTCGFVDESYFMALGDCLSVTPTNGYNQITTNAIPIHPHLATVNAVPIVLCSTADDINFISYLSNVNLTGTTANRLSTHLLKFYCDPNHVTNNDKGESQQHLIAKDNRSMIDVKEDGPAPTLTNKGCWAVLLTKMWDSDTSSAFLQRVTQKVLDPNTPAVLLSVTLAYPVHDLSHLFSVCHQWLCISTREGEGPLSCTNAYRRGSNVLFETLAQMNSSALTASVSVISQLKYVVIYCGASWCPPCLRIIADLPAMLTGFRRDCVSTQVQSTDAIDGKGGDGKLNALSVVERLVTLDGSGHHNVADFPSDTVALFLKADYDSSFEILEALDISIIPTFVVISIDKMKGECVDISKVAHADMKASLKSSVVGIIQDSKRTIVGPFLEKCCMAPLTFNADNEDF
eukprot:Tbor_TRINITY_DN5007_c0_g2::TRINITY_DN5007_c0_g2_i1::g.14268::m.14268